MDTVHVVFDQGCLPLFHTGKIKKVPKSLTFLLQTSNGVCIPNTLRHVLRRIPYLSRVVRVFLCDAVKTHTTR